MDQVVLLYIAIQGKNTEALSRLLETDGELANNWRFDPIATPLHACVFNPQCASILLEYGANPNAIDNDDNLFSPVHACAALGDAATLALLLDNGGDANARSRWGTPLHLALGNGESPLPKNYMDTVTLLLEHGADLDASVEVSSDQWTPLHQACSEGLEDAVEELIQKGAKLHIGKDGLTPMMVATSMGYNSVVSVLKSHGG